MRAENQQRGHQGERPDRGNEFQPECHDAHMGMSARQFQLSFGQVYFTGTWSICGQTAPIRASFSAPSAFFGVSSRQLERMFSGLDGL
jgi:hypothetical protein